MNKNGHGNCMTKTIILSHKLLFLLGALSIFMAACSKGADSNHGKRGAEWGDVQGFPARGTISASPGPGANFDTTAEVYYYCLSADEILKEADLTSKWQGGGYTWEAIVLAGLQILNVDMKGQIFTDPEGDALFIESPNRESLEIISKVAGKALTDEEFRNEAIKQAKRMRIME